MIFPLLDETCHNSIFRPKSPIRQRGSSVATPHLLRRRDARRQRPCRARVTSMSIHGESWMNQQSVCLHLGGVTPRFLARFFGLFIRMSTASKIGPDFDKLSWCFKSTNVLMIVIIDSSPKIDLFLGCADSLSLEDFHRVDSSEMNPVVEKQPRKKGYLAVSYYFNMVNGFPGDTSAGTSSKHRKCQLFPVSQLFAGKLQWTANTIIISNFMQFLWWVRYRLAFVRPLSTFKDGGHVSFSSAKPG